MRILLWYWGRRGGGAQYALCLSRSLARHPSVHLELSLTDSSSLLHEFRQIDVQADVIRTFVGSMGAVGGLARVPALSRRLVTQARRLRADVVFSAMSHVWTPFVAPSLAAEGLGFVPAIHDARPHPGDPALFWDWRLRTELRAARAALVFSAGVGAVLGQLRPELPLLRTSLGAHLPFSVRGHDPSMEGEFLFFGRLRAYKGLDLLRDAFRLVRARHPGATLRIVGEGSVEASAPGISALPGVKVEQRWVPDAEIPFLLARAWAVVLPYREASQSGVLPLALASGVPVVATPVGALADQLRHDYTGILAGSATAPALAEAMIQLLVPGTRAELSRAAFREGARLTDWDAQAAELVDGLRGLGLDREKLG